MKFDDFFRYFAVTAVCFYDEEWHYNWIEAYHEVKPTILKASLRSLANVNIPQN